MLRRYFELPAITTDVIVGFPGETEEDFEECRRFLETAAFSQMHIFPYSKRKGTRAETMPDQVPEERKKKRSEILLALEKQMRYNYQKLFLGKKEMLLLEEAVQIGGKTFWTGHTMRYVKVFVPSEGRKDLSNKLAEVRIKETAEFGLGGEFL